MIMFRGGILVLLLFLSTLSFSQDVYDFARPNRGGNEDSTSYKYMKMISLSLTANGWLNPPDGLEQRIFSRGFDANFMWTTKNTEKERKGNFSFYMAMGLGFSSFNLHHNGRFINRIDGATDEMTLGFSPFPDGYSYRKNKMSMNYLEFPIEFIIEEKKKKPMIILGAKFGYLVNIHSKLVDNTGRYKEYNFANTDWYRYGTYAKIHFNRIGIGAFYAFNSGFRDFSDLAPITVTLSFQTNSSDD
jgi:hypothetical protein